MLISTIPKTALQNAALDAETALVLPKNLTHNVITHIKRVKHGLAERVIAYLMTEAFP